MEWRKSEFQIGIAQIFRQIFTAHSDKPHFNGFVTVGGFLKQMDFGEGDFIKIWSKFVASDISNECLKPVNNNICIGLFSNCKLYVQIELCTLPQIKIDKLTTQFRKCSIDSVY